MTPNTTEIKSDDTLAVAIARAEKAECEAREWKAEHDNKAAMADYTRFCTFQAAQNLLRKVGISAFPKALEQAIREAREEYGQKWDTLDKVVVKYGSLPYELLLKDSRGDTQKDSLQATPNDHIDSLQVLENIRDAANLAVYNVLPEQTPKGDYVVPKAEFERLEQALLGEQV